MFMYQDKDGRMHKNYLGMALMSLLAIALIIFVGFKARNAMREYKFIGLPATRNTITVSGEGKVVAIPDIAMISLGTSIEQPTVVQAQDENTKVMNAVKTKLKDLGVDPKDVQTSNYSIYPAYDYAPGTGKQTIRGYTVSETISVKVRKIGTVGQIISTAGGLGVNQVYGMSFTVDDIESVRQQARIKALQNARAKADALAKVVGITLRRVVSFNENGGSLPPMPYYSEGMGGGGGMAIKAVAPDIQPGSNEIVITADVTYEIE